MCVESDVLWEDFCTSSNESLFVQLYERTKSLVYAICWRILRNEEDARDAFQSAYCRLVYLAGEKSARSEFSGFSFELLVRALAAREAGALSKRRQRRWRKEVVMEDLSAAPDTNDLPDQVFESREKRERIEMLLFALPDRYRVPLLLHYCQGMTHREIALCIEIPIGTVSGRIKRGRKKLEPILRRAGFSEGTAALSLLVGVATLLQPPSALSASAMLAHASAGAIALSSGSTVTTTILGVAAMKAKIVSIGAAIILAVVGTATYQTFQSPEGSTEEMAQTEATVIEEESSSPALQVEADTSAKETTIVSELPLAKSSEPKADATEATLEQTPNPSPVQTIDFHVTWKDSGEDVEGAEIKLAWQAALADERMELSGHTDSKGWASLDISENASSAIATASHPDGASKKESVNLPRSEPYEMALDRGAVLFGRVILEGEGQAAAGASIRANNTKEKGSVETTSGPDGAYELAGLDDKVMVRAWLDSYVLSPATDGRIEVSLFPGQRNGPYDLLLQEGMTLKGFIRDGETNEPIAGARIKSDLNETVSAPHGYYVLGGLTLAGARTKSDMNETVSAPDGSYVLGGLTLEGKKTLAASADGYVERTASVKLTDEGENLVDFSLDPAMDVYVLVVDRDDRPVEGADVEEIKFEPNAIFYPPAKTDLAGLSVFHRTSRLNPSTFFVRKDGYEGCYGPGIKIDREASRGDLKIVLTESSSELRVFAGKVVDSQGLPIPGIMINGVDLRTGNATPVQTLTDENGEYSLTFESPTIRFQISVSGEGWAPIIRRGVAAGTPENPAIVDFTLEWGHWLEGVVVDAEDVPVENVWVNYYYGGSPFSPVEKGVNDKHRAKTDAEGGFRLEQLPGSSVALSLNPPGRRDGKYVRTEFDNIEVDQELRLTLLEAGTISGRVVDKETGEPVRAFKIELSGDVKKSNRSFNSPEGRFALNGLLREVEYNLTVESVGYASQKVGDMIALPEGEADELEIELLKKHALEGFVVDYKDETPVSGGRIAFGDWDGTMIEWDFQWIDKGSSLVNAQKTTTLADGEFRFLEGAEGTFFIHADGYRRMVLEPDQRGQYLTKDGRLRIPLEPGESVDGMRFQIGQPAKPRAFLQLYRELQGNAKPGDAFSESFELQYVDPLGPFQWNDLRPGTYQLSTMLNIAGGTSHRYRAFKQFELMKGESKYVSICDDMGPLEFRGRLLSANGSPYRGVLIILRPAFAWDYVKFDSTASHQADGNFYFGGLKPGVYNVEASRYESGATHYATLPPIELTASLEQDIVIDLQFR